MDKIIYSSATELARAIREREVSSAEVVEAHLARIEEVNPKLNVVVQLTADAARARAREADAALARGESWGPLHGVPVTIKDAFETAGIPSVGGTKGRAQDVPEEDAVALARRVEDLALALPLLCGTDWRDPSVAPVALGDPYDVKVETLRVAVHTDNGIVAPTGDIVATVQDAARVLADAGAEVVEARPPV